MKQNIINTTEVYKNIHQYIEQNQLNNLLVFHGSSFSKLKKDFLNSFSEYNITFYSSFTGSPNLKDLNFFLKNESVIKYDLIISIGGGRIIDFAKLVKYYFNKNYVNSIEISKEISTIPHLAIPTTSGSGSESTKFAVVYDKNSKKHSVEDDRILPQYVILNYEYLKSLSNKQFLFSTLDAFAQSLESYWSVRATKESKIKSLKALKIINENLKLGLDRKQINLEKLMIASNLAGQAINISKTTAPHAYSYYLTSKFNIPHGLAVSASLIYFMSQNLKEEDEEIIRIFEVLKINELIKNITNIYNDLKIFESLKSYNLKERDVDEMINQVNTERLKNNPYEINKLELKKNLIEIFVER